MAAYLTILGTSILALAGAPWWSLLAGATVLSVISLNANWHYRTRFSAVGMSEIFQTHAISSIGASFAAAVAAFALGTTVRFIVFGSL